MTAVNINAQIKTADLDAAFQFISKRQRRNDDVLEGICTALYSVMLVTAEGLFECGLPISEVESMFDQFKRQVVFALHADAATHPIKAS